MIFASSFNFLSFLNLNILFKFCLQSERPLILDPTQCIATQLAQVFCIHTGCATQPYRHSFLDILPREWLSKHHFVQHHSEKSYFQDLLIVPLKCGFSEATFDLYNIFLLLMSITLKKYLLIQSEKNTMTASRFWFNVKQV